MTDFMHPTAMTKENVIYKSPIHLSKSTELHYSYELGKFSFINNASFVYHKTIISNFITIDRNYATAGERHLINWLSSSNFLYSNGIFPLLKEVRFNQYEFSNIRH